MLYFNINPFLEESVQLFKRSGRALFAGRTVGQLINQFPLPGAKLLSPTERAELKHGFRVLLNTIDCRITPSAKILDDYLNFSVAATVQVQAVRNPQRWIEFEIFSKLKVDSVRNEDGSPAQFFQGKESDQIWIRCDAPLRSDEVRSFTIYYHGDILRQSGARVYLQSSLEWYPRQDSWGRSRFDVTFHYPSDYTAAAVGDMEEFKEENEVTTSRWVTSLPVRNFSFNIGRFSQKVTQGKNNVFLNILSTKAADATIVDDLAGEMLMSIGFFDALFGPPPVRTLHVSEIPYFHGEAFPGMIHFSAVTFLREYIVEGATEVFRSHEVAHQWWGLGVDYRSYHDQWLSEAFSQYSGLMYMQSVLKDNDTFFKELQRYKTAIIWRPEEERKPISLGYRTGDFVVQIYQKGAWVIHMLRMMLLDLKTMKEDEFNLVLRTFYTRYRNKTATTEDFQRVVEEVSRMDLGWFFDQWIRGAGIPKYTFSYTVSPSNDRKWSVRCAVRQEGVPDDFQMLIPLHIDFGEGRFARIRVLIKGPLSEFDLPIMPFKPEEIIFNDLESVLCEVEYD
jgi:hypothetical protein